MARIWRLETVKPPGRCSVSTGFFHTRYNTNFHNIAEKHGVTPPDWGTDEYPSTYQDLKGRWKGNWAHGCNSWAEFRRWFPEYLDKALEEAGYVVSLFEVPDGFCEHGRTQSIFKYEPDWKVKSVKPTEAEKEIANAA